MNPNRNPYKDNYIIIRIKAIKEFASKVPFSIAKEFIIKCREEHSNWERQISKGFDKPKSNKIKRLPRRLKKQAKIYNGIHSHKLTNEQRLWSYLDKLNPRYKTFLIHEAINRKYE